MSQVHLPSAADAKPSGGNRIVIIDQDLCTGCGSCVDLCPKRILFLDERTGTCRVSDENQCDRLAGCQRTCPTGAIRIVR